MPLDDLTIREWTCPNCSIILTVAVIGCVKCSRCGYKDCGSEDE